MVGCEVGRNGLFFIWCGLLVVVVGGGNIGSCYDRWGVSYVCVKFWGVEGWGICWFYVYWFKDFVVFFV